MRLLLLPLAGLLLSGEALRDDTFQDYRPSTIFYTFPSPRFPGRVRAAQHTMMRKVNGQGVQRTLVNLRPTRLAPSRGLIIMPPQSHSMDKDQSGSMHTRRPSEVRQDFVPSNFGTLQTPSAVNRGHKPSSLGQAPKTSTTNRKPSSFGNVQNPSDPKSSDFDQERRPGSVQFPKTPNFNPSHEASTSHEEHEDSNKHSSSGEDHKHSSFGQNQKPSDQGSKTSFVDSHSSHPDRNPVCNHLPDSGTCRAALPRYYFDPKTGTCNCFLYGGCREDGKDESPGSFFTLEECQRECRPPKLEEGPICKDIFKEEQFISYLVDPLPQNTNTDHLSDAELLASFYK